MTRDQVINLILHMQNLDKDYARTVYVRENKNHPEWNLFDAVKQAMEQAK